MIKEEIISIENIYTNKEFCKILNFYLFNCPVVFDLKKKIAKNKYKVVGKKKVSKNAVTFEEKGLTNSFLTSFLSEMKKTSSSHLVYNSVGNKDDINNIMNNSYELKSLNDKYAETIIFKENHDIGKTKTIFYCIRNAFAHGDFKVLKYNDNIIYIFKSSKNNEIKGFIRLREKTLLRWISLFNDFSKKSYQKTMKKTKKV